MRTRSAGQTAVLVATAIVAVVVMAFTVGWTGVKFWWDSEPRVAVTPDDDGVATIGEVGFRLTSFEQISSVDTGFEVWDPPAGMQLWRVELETVTTGEDTPSCELQVLVEDGRIFTPSEQVPDAEEAVWGLTCGYEAEDGPTQILDVLLPEDAVPAQLRIIRQYEDGLPRYWAFDVSE